VKSRLVILLILIAGCAHAQEILQGTWLLNAYGAQELSLGPSSHEVQAGASADLASSVAITQLDLVDTSTAYAYVSGKRLKVQYALRQDHSSLYIVLSERGRSEVVININRTDAALPKYDFSYVMNDTALGVKVSKPVLFLGYMVNVAGMTQQKATLLNAVNSDLPFRELQDAQRKAIADLPVDDLSFMDILKDLDYTKTMSIQRDKYIAQLVGNRVRWHLKLLDSQESSMHQIVLEMDTPEFHDLSGQIFVQPVEFDDAMALQKLQEYDVDGIILNAEPYPGVLRLYVYAISVQ
jgi:hypothetical protein